MQECNFLKTLILIPAFNEAGNIENVIADVQNNAPECDYLVINDCSTDDTPSILRRMNASYLSLPVNLGIGGCVQTGYRYAFEHGYDIAVQFDGDGQHDAAYISALVAPLESGEADCTVGSRFVENVGFQSTAARRAGIVFLRKIIKILGGTEVLDVTSGMRAVNRKLIACFSENYAQDYPEPEALLIAELSGASIKEVPVIMHERQSGKSSIHGFRNIYYMIKVSLSLLLTKISVGKGRRV